jgi:hypothetical protein
MKVKQYEIDGSQQYRVEGLVISTDKKLVKKYHRDAFANASGKNWVAVPCIKLTTNPESLYGKMQVLKITETLGEKRVLLDNTGKFDNWDETVKRECATAIEYLTTIPNRHSNEKYLIDFRRKREWDAIRKST